MFEGELKKISILYDAHVGEYFFPDLSLDTFNLIIEKDGYAKITALSQSDYDKYKDEYNTDPDRFRYIDYKKEKIDNIFEAFDAYFSKYNLENKVSLVEGTWYVTLFNEKDQVFNYKLQQFVNFDVENNNLAEILSENLGIEELKILS
jgi:hypothetical protein